MAMLPRFSIVVPTFDRHRQLASCLRSITRLDYPADRFEVIVVNDGGEPPPEPDRDDGLSDYTLLRQVNAGPGAARNLGASAASGEFLAFVDDDCAPAADWLTKLARRLVDCPDRLVGGRTINRLVDNLYSSTSQSIVDVVYSHYNADPARARFLASNNMAVNAELFRDAGGFDERFRVSEDREFCDRWLMIGRQAMYAPEAIVYHAHDLSFASFCRQHFSYGQGAHRFYQVRARRGSGTMRQELAFHANVRNWLLSPLRGVTAGARPGRAALMVVWQVTNAVGFLTRAVRPNLHV
jgi:GT2 family glycosyltransferase